MNLMKIRRDQRGATLLIGMVMLLVITLVAVSGFTLSSSNLKAVGNTQFRDEAIAAANFGIEQIISSDFTALPVTAVVLIDINQDGNTDYTVNVDAPVCIQATSIAGSIETLSGVSSGVTGGSDFNTVWEIVSSVTSVSTGADVTIRQGIRRRLTQTQYNSSACNI